jgi:cell division protein FtsX
LCLIDFICMWKLVLSELQEWWKVLLSHKFRSAGFFLVLVLLVMVLQLALLGYGFADETLGYLSSEIDVLVDVQEGVSKESVSDVLAKIERMDGVSAVTFLSEDDALSFVSKEVVPGYGDFLANNRLSNPFGSVVRIQVTDVALLRTLKTDLIEAYDAVFVGSEEPLGTLLSSMADGAVRFIFAFSGVVSWIVGGVSVLILAAYFFFLWDILQGRKHEFFMVNLIGLHHHFYRWSFCGMAMIVSFSTFLLGYFGFGLLTGLYGSFLLWQVFVLFLVSSVVSELAYRNG